MIGIQHFLLGKIQAKHGILSIIIPVNQLIYYVIIGFEWQDVPDYFNVKKILFGNVS
jgi:hypothetical protein